MSDNYGFSGAVPPGLTSNIYFDHNGDGSLTRTSWAGNSDALLV